MNKYFGETMAVIQHADLIPAPPADHVRVYMATFACRQAVIMFVQPWSLWTNAISIQVLMWALIEAG